MFKFELNSSFKLDASTDDTRSYAASLFKNTEDDCIAEESIFYWELTEQKREQNYYRSLCLINVAWIKIK